MSQRINRIGTSMVLYITCIKSEAQFMKFWMITQSDFENFKIVESKLVENSAILEATSRAVLPQIAPGFLCAVKSKIKNRWCRARVLRIIDRSHILVRLMDYGYDETVSVGDVGKSEDQALNFFQDLATECILADVVPFGLHWTPVAVNYCEENLVDKNLNGSIISFFNNIPVIRIAIMGENEPFVQRLINMNLARIDDAIRTSSYKSVSLTPNTAHLVNVSCVENHMFYVQLVTGDVDLKLIMDAIKSWSECEQPTLVNAPIKGTPCLAKIQHKPCYYRALITSVVQDKCQVRFVDYGYTEMKHFYELCAIPPMFLNLPAQAIPCAFPKDTITSKEDFIRATCNKQLNCFVMGQVSELYIVKLSHGDRDVFSTQAQSNVLFPQMLFKYRRQELVLGVPVDVTISVINDLDDFYCQLNQQKDQLEIISNSLNQGYEFLTLSFHELQPGLPICVKFSDDKRWYRAEVIKTVSENHIEVFFVDFGNIEITKLSDARRLNSSCLQYPTQAFKCSLIDAEALLSSPSRENLFEFFEEQVIGQNVFAEVKGVSNESYSVKLFEKNSTVSINEKLLSKSVNIESVSVSNVENLYVTSFDSPSSFFAQFEKLDQAKLAEMQDEIDAAYCTTQNSKFKPNVGDFVCAKFVHDERFYRGKVEALKNNAFEVFFIDYGNRELVPLQDIHPMNVKFARFPIFGIICGFVKFPAKLPFDSLKSLILENSIKANMIQNQKGKWMISLTEDFPGNVTILEYFRQHEAPQLNYGAAAVGFGGPLNDVKIDRYSPTNCRMPNVTPVSATFSTNLQHSVDYEDTVIPPKAVRNVFVCHAVSPNEFYCQVEEDSSKLQLLMKNIEEMYKNLNQNDLKFDKFLIGSPCCAKYQEDGIWYRAKIKATNPRNNPVTCDVFFVDYGNTDSVQVSNVRILPPNFISLSPQALKCSSYNLLPPSGGAWSDEECDAFYDMVCDKSFVAQFIEVGENDSYVVNLVSKVKIENESLSKEFLNLRKGNSQTSNDISNPCAQAISNANPQIVSNPKSESFSDPKPQMFSNPKPQTFSNPKPQTVPDPNPHIVSTVTSFSVPNVKIGFLEGVEVTWILNPCEFYCQLKSSASDFKKMMTNMQAHYNAVSESKSILANPGAGMICVTQFSQDMAWYRGKIQKVERSDATVFYVDYGNSEKVNKSGIRSVSQDYTSLPKQSIKCYLNGVKRLNNCTFTPQMAQKYFDGDLKCKFISREKDYFIVDIMCNQSSVAQKMIKDGIVVDKNAPNIATSVSLKENIPNASIQKQPRFYPSQKLSFVSGQLISVIVSFVENPGEFWCQLQDESAKLDELMTSIDQHYTVPENAVAEPYLRVGSACIAKYSVDGGWYRAVVKTCPSPKEYGVMFIDYGNAEVTARSEVCEIQPEFSELPPQAFLCKLHNIPPNICGKAEATTLFQSLVDAAEELTAKVETPSKDCCSVSLFYDQGTEEIIVSETLRQSFGSAASPSDGFVRFVPPEVPLGSQEGYVTVVFNPHHFYVQLATCEAPLAELSTSLTEKCELLTGDQNAVSNPQIGLACSAKYSVDEVWYRAEIMSLTETTASVSFVDYGNIEDVATSTLKTLDDDFIAVPPYAIKCKMNGITPKAEQWSDAAITAFEELVNDVALGVTFISKEIPASVNISNDGKDVSQALIDMEMADADLTEESYSDEQLATVVSASDLATYPDRTFSIRFAAKISFVDSYDRFFVTPIELSTDLDTVTTTLETLYGSATESDFVFSDPKPHMPCAAKYSEDEAWYRALVTDVKGEDIFINFVDYGNSEVITAKDLKSLTPELKQIPPLAIEGSLYGMKTVEGKEPDVKLKLEDAFLNDIEIVVEICDEKSTTVKLKSDSDIVNLLITEGLVELTDHKPFEHLNNSETFKENLKIAFVDELHEEAKQIPSPVVSEKEIVGHLSHFEINDDIVSLYITLDEKKEALEIQQGNLYELFDGSSESDSVSVKTADFCAAKFAEDGSWNRATVISCKEEIIVKFVDYGNCVQVPKSDIRELPAEYFNDPCFAIQCNFSGYKVANDQSSSLEVRINDLLFNGPLNLTIGCFSDNVPFVQICKIIAEDSDFIETMVSEQLLCQHSTDELNKKTSESQLEESIADNKANRHVDDSSDKPECDENDGIKVNAVEEKEHIDEVENTSHDEEKLQENVANELSVEISKSDIAANQNIVSNEKNSKPLETSEGNMKIDLVLEAYSGIEKHFEDCFQNKKSEQLKTQDLQETITYSNESEQKSKDSCVTEETVDQQSITACSKNETYQQEELFEYVESEQTYQENFDAENLQNENVGIVDQSEDQQDTDETEDQQETDETEDQQETDETEDQQETDETEDQQQMDETEDQQDTDGTEEQQDNETEDQQDMDGTGYQQTLCSTKAQQAVDIVPDQQIMHETEETSVEIQHPEVDDDQQDMDKPDVQDMDEREGQQNINEPEDQQNMNEPEDQQNMNEPEDQQNMNEPEDHNINESEDQQNMNKPEAQQDMKKPEDQQATYKPEGEQKIDKSEDQQAFVIPNDKQFASEGNQDFIHNASMLSENTTEQQESETDKSRQLPTENLVAKTVDKSIAKQNMEEFPVAAKPQGSDASANDKEPYLNSDIICTEGNIATDNRPVDKPELKELKTKEMGISQVVQLQHCSEDGNTDKNILISEEKETTDKLLESENYEEDKSKVASLKFDELVICNETDLPFQNNVSESDLNACNGDISSKKDSMPTNSSHHDGSAEKNILSENTVIRHEQDSVLVQFLKVSVSEIKVVNQKILIAVTPSDCVEALDNMQSSMQRVYSLEHESPEEICTDSRYAIRSKDDRWYRGKVLEEIGNDVTVLYIDNGKSETVERDSVKELEEEHEIISPFAIWCHLTSAVCLTSEEEVKSEIEKMLEGADVYVKVIEDCEPWIVSLEANGQNVLLELDSKRLVDLVLEKTLLKPGHYKAKVSHVDISTNHTELYVIIDFFFKSFNELKRKMQNAYKFCDPSLTVNTEKFYAVHHNNSWLRCTVMSQGSKLTVRLIDTGEAFETNLSSLHPLLPEHYLDPPCGIPCQLPPSCDVILCDDVSLKCAQIFNSCNVLVYCEEDDSEGSLCHLRATLQDSQVLTLLKKSGLITFDDSILGRLDSSEPFDPQETEDASHSIVGDEVLHKTIDDMSHNSVTDDAMNGNKCSSTGRSRAAT